MKICPKCNSQYGNEYGFCKKCGSKLVSSQGNSESVGYRAKGTASHEDVSFATKKRKDSVGGSTVFFAVAILVLGVAIGFFSFKYFAKDDGSAVASRSPSSSKPYSQKQEGTLKDIEKRLEQLEKQKNDYRELEKDLAQLKLPSGQQTVKPTIPRFYDGAISEAYHSSADVEGSYVHSAQKAIDGNIASCWAEGVAGLGVGENIVIRFNGIYELNGMYFWSGHQKTEALYYKNARPTAVRVVASDGYNQIHRIRNIMGMQTINFYRPVYTDEVKIILEGCDSGTTYADTCIAEVNFF